MSEKADTRCAACRASAEKRNCAFETGVFQIDNNQCATLEPLRVMLEEASPGWGEPRRAGFSSIRVSHIESQTYAIIDACELDAMPDDDPLCLFVSYYKRRGKTEVMQFMFDDGNPPRPPTEQECLAIAKAYGYGV